MSLRREYDVVVVGAGPSGAAAAGVMAEAGLGVLVLERKKLPRYKICSGLINEKSLKLTERHFGKIPEECYCRPKIIKGVRLWHDAKRSRDWPFGEKGAPNVWRAQYDEWLIRRSGAEVRDQCLLKDFAMDGDGVRLYCRDHREGAIEIDCKYLVSAEGCLSSIRAKLTPELETRSHWFLAYQNYYEGSSELDPEWYHGFLDPAFGEIYGWFNVKDDYVIFGTSCKKGGRFAPYLGNFSGFLKEHFGLRLGKLVRKSSCLGTNMCATGNFYLGKDRVLLVGEAAGFLNMFGEGISSALATGLLAGQAISQAALNSGPEALEIYTELSKRERRETLASWKLASRLAGRPVMV
ncbi:MAG: NAD(P)/FAD-dependent oxidoreductase [Candidatus Brocadiales bacterium]